MLPIPQISGKSSIGRVFCTALGALLLSGCAVTGAESVAQGNAAPEPVDVLITGGIIHDGSGAAPFVGDVAITGDRIAYVGPSRARPAREVFDASGMIVSPGFIDPHTHADGFLNSEDVDTRRNVAWLMQGASTVAIGVDGFGSPDIAKQAGALAAVGIGTNVIPFVGFGAVREQVLGQSDRAPSSGELAEMKQLVASAMCQGARGFSTGLFYAPQSYADTAEVIALAREAGQRGGLYDTHQRDKSSYSIGLLQSVDEAIEIGRAAQISVHIAHIKALGVDVHGMAPQVIARIDAARAAGTDVTADQYPWLASGSSLDAALLPRWAVDGGSTALLKRLDDPQLRTRIEAEMAENLRRRGGAESLLLTASDLPWTGKTLEQVADEGEVTPIAAALRIIRDSIEHRGGRGTAVASFNMSQHDVDLFMQQPWLMTASDGSNGHPRMYATYPEKYRKYVVDRGVIDLPTFIRQSTGLVADNYGLSDRGYLRRGYAADVLVFDPEHFAPRATYLNPREESAGVVALYVNGVAAVANGRPTQVTAGRVLLRKAVPQCPAPAVPSGIR